MKKYFIEVGTVNKAKEDIDEICRREGFCNLTSRNFGHGGVGRFMTKLVSVCRIPMQLKKGDLLFLQYPMKKFYKMACLLAKMKGARVVTVIHDLGAFRRHKLTPQQENRRLAKTDFLIVHNPTMRDYLIKHGFKGGIHCLQIFDYLSDVAVRNGWQMDLYGKGFEAEANNCQQLTYHGFMPSDEFIAKVEADFGLVWDGSSVDECTGDWGEYLRINDPHKTSFYLRAGIPVIVWKQAAMAPFIEEQGVGIAVDSLSEIDSRLAALSAEDYKQMRHAAWLMSQRLAEGYYIKEGLKAAML